MISITPAVIFGALAVVGVVYIVTTAVLSKIAKRDKGVPTLYRDTMKEMRRVDDLTEENIDRVAKITGVIAVVLVVLLMLVTPKEWATAIWIVLTVLGILFGLLTFLLRGPTNEV